MGRGRQKAKHTKVARQLKYSTPNTDLSELEKELQSAKEENQYIDKWSDYIDDFDEVEDTVQ